MNNVVITAAKCGFGLVRSTSDNIIFSHALHASDVASVCKTSRCGCWGWSVGSIYFGKEHLGLISLIINNPHMQCMQRSLHNSQVTDFLNNVIIYMYT